MPSPWRKFENENGFPYYINETTNIKQWDHPKFTDIIQRLDDCNYIRYSTYRVAAKFRVLQHALYMNEVPLSVIIGVFERHKLGATESSLSLESYDLEAVLSDIYFAANKQNHTNTDIDFASELMMNFLYNVFDRDRRENIQVSSTKLILAILSSCKLSDLYYFIFNLCADHNNCITRLKLQMILTKFANVAAYLHEDVNFGHHLINVAIDHCFNNSPGLVGVSESSFTAWLENSPQLLSWIPTLHRMKAAESVVHAAKCSVCKASPLLGLRYRCVKCSSYTQCQHCFLSARVNHSHKLSHPMKEYCTEGNSKDFTHMLIKKLCRLLRCSVNLNPPNFAANVVEAKVLSNNKDCLFAPTGTESSCDIEPLSSPQMQLQVVIRQLELQNRELQQVVTLNGNDKEMKKYLEEHRLHVAAQIQKLKILKEYLQTAQPTIINNSQPQAMKRMESTPLIANGRNNRRNRGFDMLSPITPISEYSANDDRQNSNWNGDQNRINGITHTVDFVPTTNSMPSYSVKDISSWIGGHPTTSDTNLFRESSDSVDSSESTHRSPVREMHNDLDEVLAKLQQILANNFMLDEALGGCDNGQLKSAVTEVEGMLTSLIDGVEHSRSNSVSQETTSCDREQERETTVF
ncbi:hypothetical protein ILUMI_08792 [Ignelater luminosus]|uniref:Dystrophin n=1 Tax=Ignelater luminosus TaxID=2038154 RepID=A0A8K0D692_IGNLU|nr:hypothetical protein ILUMI_08792 [Ignelater luminosus]